MIYDHIDNIELYKGLSADIYEGLRFLQQVSTDISVGAYQLNPRVKAIVSEYETKPVNVHGFEAHKKNIDIQFLLQGEERISCLPIKKLVETRSYKEESDASLFKAIVPAQEMIIGKDYFAIFYPQDGHMPQLCVDKPIPVKKVVVKVNIM